jgi:hypothetical protein
VAPRSKHTFVLAHGFDSARLSQNSITSSNVCCFIFCSKWIKNNTTNCNKTSYIYTILVHRLYSSYKFFKSIRRRQMEFQCCLFCSKAVSCPSHELKFPLFSSKYFRYDPISAVFRAVQNQSKKKKKKRLDDPLCPLRFLFAQTLYISLNADWNLLKSGPKFTDKDVHVCRSLFCSNHSKRKV